MAAGWGLLCSDNLDRARLGWHPFSSFPTTDPRFVCRLDAITLYTHLPKWVSTQLNVLDGQGSAPRDRPAVRP